MTVSERPRALRRVGALGAGLLVVVVLSTATDALLHAAGVYPPAGQPMAGGLFLLATAYRLAFGTLGSLVAARLAPVRPMWHAVALGALGTVLALAGLLATWNAALGPRWYPVALVVTALPCAWLGGRLAEGPARSHTAR
ncbi:MAG: hypothetical protein ABW221_05625 [Vicinamibacteria bacterium]